jgi:GT2 family glycosyltransferase
MALISMAVYDTEENKRTAFTEQTLHSFYETVDFEKNRLVLIDNNSCQRTKDILEDFAFDVNIMNDDAVKVITLPENVGTAKAVNKGLEIRKEGECCIKMDNDVVVHKKGWIEDMEEVIRRMPNIGVLGLKRKDVMESPYAINTDQRSRLLMVPHETGQRWHVIEECKQVMGTCTMFNPALLDKVGYLYQMEGLYGFDDSLMNVRSNIAGFLNCFLLGIDIDHVDPGGGEYTDWKSKYAGEILQKYAQTEAAYRSGARSIYEKI